MHHIKEVTDLVCQNKMLRVSSCISYRHVMLDTNLKGLIAHQGRLCESASNAKGYFVHLDKMGRLTKLQYVTCWDENALAMSVC